YVCHGPSQQMRGFRLDNGAAALEGGYSGNVILPGNSGASKLIQRISSDNKATRMPPAGAPLTKTEIDVLKTWIDAGARWPERAPVKELSETDKAKHWAFRAIQHPAPPDVISSNWVRNPVDRFILAKLENEGVDPSPEADKITLARRVHFDLIGLPPTPEEVDRFVADTHPAAYEHLVDRLLASRHYGEKWAQQWLDAGRYADSDG
ncbi:MAG: DUF1549 domain-containing protein, partial [bacterium]|nr:DUF1549 domain-containing protein [bacterium]